MPATLATSSIEAAFSPLVGDTVNQVFAIDERALFRAVAPLPARIGPKASRAVHV